LALSGFIEFVKETSSTFPCFDFT